MAVTIWGSGLARIRPVALEPSAKLNVLALSAYHGGSHAQFLDEWTLRSRHNFTCLTLPARHFKWRMRQAAIGMAAAVERLWKEGAQFDIVWTTSMLDAAELMGLLPKPLRCLPLVAYFHENQLVYPVRKAEERDQHFALTNWASALAADEVWFNSAFNRDSMLKGLEQLLKLMPDEHSASSLEAIRARSRIEPLGIVSPGRGKKAAGPLHIAWVGRWEHDKRPETFFASLRKLREKSVPFRLTVLGQSFRVVPPAFAEARQEFRDAIAHFGFAETREEYERLLGRCDVVVSTADHEFFGVALLEAVAAGALPLVPARLVYPEVYPSSCLYSNEADLLERLLAWAKRKDSDRTLEAFFDSLHLGAVSERYAFDRRAPELDAELLRVATQANP